MIVDESLHMYSHVGFLAFLIPGDTSNVSYICSLWCDLYLPKSLGELLAEKSEAVPRESRECSTMVFDS